MLISFVATCFSVVEMRKIVSLTDVMLAVEVVALVKLTSNRFGKRFSNSALSTATNTHEYPNSALMVLSQLHRVGLHWPLRGGY